MSKFKNFTLLFSCIPFLLVAQAINPPRAVIGSATSTLPTDAEAQNVPLIIWNSATTGFYSPTLQIASPNGRLTLAVANEIGAYGAVAKGDIVFRPSTGKRIIFNLNTTNEANTRFAYFGTEQTSYKTFVVSNGDKVGMGTDNFPTNDPNFRLYVKGGIKAQEIKVELCSASSWCDYVFEKNYKLMPLPEVKKYITANRHLPKTPSAETLAREGGVELGKMTILQQEKIEELFLDVIQLEEKMKKIIEDNKNLKKEIAELKK